MATSVSQLRNVSRDAYDALEDRLLVLDFQAGNMASFVEIHRRYAGLARHVCGRILANSEDADEALQETMIRVFQGLHRFNGQYALQPWIARIATNVSLDALRTRSRRPQTDRGLFDEPEPEDPADGPEELTERLVERDLVISVLTGMPESHRRALVLRELEGRSHKEIAEDLGMTPAQAKALIHRAKGSFRRRWLIAITERGGLTGFALMPVMWLSKLGGALRRVVDRAGEAGQAAATQAVQLVNSSPAVPAATSQTGERVVAAAVTILVAGSVTIGAATLTHRKPSQGVTAAPSPAFVAPPSQPSTAPAVGEPRIKPAKATHHQHKRAVPPAEEGSPSPTDSTSPSTSPSPTGEGSAPPVLAEPPGFTLASSSDFATSVRCDCGQSPTTLDVVHAKQDGVSSFEETVQNAAMNDASGATAWALDIDQSSPDGIQHEMTFDLWTEWGPERFTATGALALREQTAWGGWTYVYTGSYAFLGGPGFGLPLVPANGTYRMAVTFSTKDSRVVSTRLTLTQVASPSPSPSLTASPQVTPTPSP